MRFGALHPALALLLLAGCNSGGSSDYASFFQIARESVKASFGKGGITRAQAAAVPYASMGIRLNDGPQAMMILATQTGASLLWTSGSHIVLQTENGLIKHTVGLPQDMTLTAQNGRDLTPPGDSLRAPNSQTRLADFPDMGAYSVVIMCRAQRLGPQLITILGKKIRTTRVDERCTGPALRWIFVNNFWVDETGFVWRSRQHIHPKGETLEIEIFRPPQ